MSFRGVFLPKMFPFVKLYCEKPLKNGGLNDLKKFSDFFIRLLDLKGAMCDNTRVFKYQKVFGRLVRGLGPLQGCQKPMHCVPGRTKEVKTDGMRGQKG